MIYFNLFKKYVNPAPFPASILQDTIFVKAKPPYGLSPYMKMSILEKVRGLIFQPTTYSEFRLRLSSVEASN
ncbi:MAG: hypothetical protein COZ89_02485 [Candidatus Nealsonbacteria bacterium CG_4_8_14_3_um_filter_37_23]|nr:MAG: hypothetical protein COZ89_02485 [Candidatus Nealsonbacteria bacterium CG_4_8_14_3_um_filter_37_23]